MPLLPLATPYVAPSDRDMLPSERRSFVNTHRTCVFGYGRQNDGPAMSVVYYVPDDTGTLFVYCDAVIERDPERICDVKMGVAWRMSGEELPQSVRPMVHAMREQEDRVVLRCTPYATFASPPRHLARNEQDEKLTHWLSGSVPWTAEDPVV